MKRLLTLKEIEACQTIGRDEEAKRTTIALVEFDALCEAAKEAVRLQKKIAKLQNRKDFTGTKFHHFNRIGTVAVRAFTEDQVKVGLALVALPKYKDARGTIIRTNDLIEANDEGDIETCDLGDQYNHALGRLISHGRAVACRGHAGIWPMEYVKAKIIEIRELEKSIPDLEAFTRRMAEEAQNEFEEDFLMDVQQRAAIQSALKSAFTSED